MKKNKTKGNGIPIPKKYHTIGVKISKPLHFCLIDEAKVTGYSVSDIVRNMIKNHYHNVSGGLV